MDISASYTTASKIQEDKNHIEDKKIVLEEKEYLFAQLLKELSDNINALRIATLI